MSAECSEELLNRFTGFLPYSLADTKRCWVWLMSRRRDGYAQMRDYVTKKNFYVHRLSYELFIGDIPEGSSLDHLCRNPRCLNPCHLEVVTHKENVLRGIGPTAINAKKTHCHVGHPLSGENLYVRKSGHRRCRECNRLNKLKRKESTHAPII